MDRRKVDLVVSRTSGGAQGRSSWEGAPKARAEGAKKKKAHEVGLFFSGKKSGRFVELSSTSKLFSFSVKILFVNPTLEWR